MNKRLTRSDYLFTLIFIFMLAFAVAAFFYGIQIGTQRTEARYLALHPPKQEVKPLTAYDQQVLVAFYHTIYSPFGEFQKKWLQRMDELDYPSTTIEPKSLIKELSGMAEKKYTEIQAVSMPVASPLLQQAQTDLLKSLKLFSQSSNRIAAKAGSMKTADLKRQIESDPGLQQAVEFALGAQQDYYEAIVKWNESVSPGLPGQDLLTKSDLDFANWSKLDLNEKNAFIAGMLLRFQLFAAYYPQDMTVRVDEMLASGSAEKLKLASIAAVVRTLVDTSAVRSGDFAANRDKYYVDPTLPQLPFFLD